jgi:hypothetical protein
LATLLGESALHFSLWPRLIHGVQTFNRRFNSAYRETVYEIAYLDLAKRTEWVREVPMASPDGGTASYSLLYTLLSLFRNQAFTSLLELGVGQSSRLLAQYAGSLQIPWTAIEEDQFWLQQVAGGFANVTPVYAPLKPTCAGGKDVLWYGCDVPATKFDFVLIDGPAARARAQRYSRLGILSWLPQILKRDFVIVIDDASRPGERLLVELILKRLHDMSVGVEHRVLFGATTQAIIATQLFRRCLYI